MKGKSLQEVELEMSEEEKDIGVLVDRNLSFSKHITQKVNKTNSIMGLIRRTYTFLNETSFRFLFQALVRPNWNMQWQCGSLTLRRTLN